MTAARYFVTKPIREGSVHDADGYGALCGHDDCTFGVGDPDLQAVVDAVAAHQAAAHKAEHRTDVETTKGGPGLTHAMAVCSCGWRGKRWAGPMAEPIAWRGADDHVDTTRVIAEKQGDRR